jgi:hypothetical protein
MTSRPAPRCQDYEHFEDCEHCRSRQKIHRIIDVSLIVLASVSGSVFLQASVIRHLRPGTRSGSIGSSEVCAFRVSLAGGCSGSFAPRQWWCAAGCTPRDRLPAEIREHLPELRLKIAGS